MQTVLVTMIWSFWTKTTVNAGVLVEVEIIFDCSGGIVV
jgi:hypothetical protein